MLLNEMPSGLHEFISNKIKFIMKERNPGTSVPFLRAHKLHKLIRPKNKLILRSQMS